MGTLRYEAFRSSLHIQFPSCVKCFNWDRPYILKWRNPPSFPHLNKLRRNSSWTGWVYFIVPFLNIFFNSKSSRAIYFQSILGKIRIFVEKVSWWMVYCNSLPLKEYPDLESTLGTFIYYSYITLSQNDQNLDIDSNIPHVSTSNY